MVVTTLLADEEEEEPPPPPPLVRVITLEVRVTLPGVALVVTGMFDVWMCVGGKPENERKGETRLPVRVGNCTKSWLCAARATQQQKKGEDTNKAG